MLSPSSRRAKCRPRPATYLPRLEALEDRCLLAFGTSGIVVTDFGGDDVAKDVTLQSDGRIVAVGWGGPGFALARYNTDGTLDAGFDGDGKVATAFGSLAADRAYGVALQADGKIVAAGADGEVPDQHGQTFDFGLARYNLNGRLDTSFDRDGKVITDFGSKGFTGTWDRAYDVAIQPDGKILAVGDTTAGSHTALARYNADGKLDITFGNKGKVTIGPGGVLALALQTDGKIVVVGQTYLARYNGGGSLDAGFGTSGSVTLPFLGGRSAAIQADGKIVVTGATQNVGADFALARYNPDGTLDTSFDGDGLVTTDIGGARDMAEDVLIQADGKIVVAGYRANTDSDGEFALARYNPDGTLDMSFNSAGPLPGTVVTVIGSGNGRAFAALVQPDGKIVAVGSAANASGNADFALMRYYPDGSLDDGSQDAPALQASSVAKGRRGAAALAAEQVQPLLAEALARWQAAGADLFGLTSIDVRVADLGGWTLGLASGNTLWLDDDAAGWGWYLDGDPKSDNEFWTPGNQGEQNGMDLLSVLMHELGHLLGHEHEDDGVMAETLEAGTRLTLLDAAFSDANWLFAIDGLCSEAWSKKRK